MAYNIPRDVAQAQVTKLRESAHQRDLGPEVTQPVTDGEELISRLSNQADALHEITNHLKFGIDRLVGSNPEKEETNQQPACTGPLFFQLRIINESFTRSINKIEEQLQRLNSI